MRGLMNFGIRDRVRRIMALDLEEDPDSEVGKRTDRARKVLLEATLEARKLGHNRLGTGHLLLGILKEEKGSARAALSDQNVTLEKVRDYVNDPTDSSKHTAQRVKKWPLTRASQKAMRLSWSEARKFHHNYIDPEHILLGLLDEGENSANQILDELDSDLDEIRQEVVSSLDS